MNEERMSILNMLADGKITSEEADELLRALGRGERQEEPEPVPQPALAFSDQAAFELLADIDSSTRLHSDLELEMLKRTEDQIHARFNRGGATIRLDAECAKVVIRRETYWSVS